MPWRVEHSRGLAGPFHARTVDHLVGPTVWAHQVDGPALVLGSTTDESLVRHAEAERLGIEVCRRRSGGGLVLVEPDTSCWIDVLVPREPERRSPGIPWDDDVNRSFHWIGDVWRAALSTLGVDDLEVWNGPLTNARAGAALCFAGLGPGEVVGTDPDDRVAKVVGLSQRRTRWGARYQGLYVQRWSAERLAAVIDESVLPEGLRIDELRYGADALGHSGEGGVGDGTVGDSTVGDVTAGDGAAGDRSPPPDEVGRAVVEALEAAALDEDA